MDVHGDMVQDMYDAGRLAEIHDYCRCDVLDTYFVFLRTRVMVGQLTLQAEQEIIAETKAWLEQKAEARRPFVAISIIGATGRTRGGKSGRRREAGWHWLCQCFGRATSVCPEGAKHSSPGQAQRRPGFRIRRRKALKGRNGLSRSFRASFLGPYPPGATLRLPRADMCRPLRGIKRVERAIEAGCLGTPRSQSKSAASKRR